MPLVVTFGMPAAAVSGCELVPSARFYRFVNSKKEDDEDEDVAFDPVPFSTTLGSGAVHYGHYLLVGEDKNNAVYLGLDQNYTFEPTLSDSQNEIDAHSMAGISYSYESRMGALLDTAKNTSMPVSTDGFDGGTLCEPEYAVLCASGSCQDFMCASQIEELCIKNSCKENSDCVSGSCVWGACALSDGEVEDGCPCGQSGSCASKQCDRTLSLDLDWMCYNSTSGVSTMSIILSMTVLVVATLLM